MYNIGFSNKCNVLFLGIQSIPQYQTSGSHISGDTWQKQTVFKIVPDGDRS